MAGLPSLGDTTFIQTVLTTIKKEPITSAMLEDYMVQACGGYDILAACLPRFAVFLRYNDFLIIYKTACSISSRHYSVLVSRSASAL